MLLLPSLPPIGRCGEPAAWNQYVEFDLAGGCREYVEGLDFLVQKWAAQWQPPGVRAPPAPTGRPLPLSGTSWLDRSQCHAALELCKAGCTCDSGRGGGGDNEVGCVAEELDPSSHGLLDWFVLFPVSIDAGAIGLEARQRFARPAPLERAFAVEVSLPAAAQPACRSSCDAER